MKRTVLRIAAIMTAWLACTATTPAGVIFDEFSPYHHIQVIDNAGLRTLSFNGSAETRMSLANRLRGHFEYTEYFHMPWIWNPHIKRVLMVGLGGGSTQRAFEFYYTNVLVETVELDPVVVSVAKKYFAVTEHPKHKIHNQDGRVFLRRSTAVYDAIIMDAYTTSRYGSSIPPHLTTKEFFVIAKDRLATNGVLAYNIIGQVRGWKADFVGALYRTMNEVFPRVYLFPARETQNVVMIATRSAELYDSTRVQRDGTGLLRNGKVKIAGFASRLRSFSNVPPPAAAESPILTDDRAPVEGLISD